MSLDESIGQLDLPEGTVLQGRYEIVRVVSRGGMGRIFMARDLRFRGQLRAIKQLLPSHSLDPEQRANAIAMFEREAGLLASLRHAHMPGVFDHFVEDDVPYVVMHFVEGETLAVRLAGSPNGLPETEVLQWGVQLCDILDYLHSQKPPVVFRDLKPSNIMIDQAGAVQLIDFGIARLFRGSVDRQSDTVIVGTPGYASPEQYGLKGETTPRSDVYSLGATLYHLLTGLHPAMTPFVFQPPHQVNPSISDRASQAIMQALENDPARRFPTAAAFKAALQAAIPPAGAAQSSVYEAPPTQRPAPGRGQPSSSTPPNLPNPPTPDLLPPPTRPVRSGWTIALGAAVGGGVVFVAFVVVAAVVLVRFTSLFGSGQRQPTATSVTTIVTATAEAVSQVLPTENTEGSGAVSVDATPAATVAVDVITPTSPAAQAGREYELAFVSDELGDERVLKMRVDQSGPAGVRALDQVPGYDRQWWPTWCTDRIYIELRQRANTTFQEIWSLDVEPGGTPQFWGPPVGADNVGAPRCSPDGRTLAFSVILPGSSHWELWLYDLASGQAHPLDGSGFLNGYPTWTARQDQVAYYHVSSQGSAGAVRFGTPDQGVTGEQAPALTKDGQEIEDVIFPAISPDGEKVAFGCTIDGSTRLCLMDSDGSNVTLLVSAPWHLTGLQVSANVKPVTPMWSPDGEWIAFVSTQSGNPDIWRIRRDGTGLQNLTAGHAANDFIPAWRP